MKEHVKISNAVVKRLPIYLRYLEDLMKNNVERISSNELSSLIGFTASQIRQDLNNFRRFRSAGVRIQYQRSLQGDQFDPRTGPGVQNGHRRNGESGTGSAQLFEIS